MSVTFLTNEDKNVLEQSINHLSEEIAISNKVKVALPQENGVVSHGTVGQFAVSDGQGGIVWKTLVEAEEVSY